LDVAFTVKNRTSGSNKQASFERNVSCDFPIVGVGASAGGLEAFRELLEFLPIDTGLAFVIIQHLAAGQESMLTDILSRFTVMPVYQVENGLQVEPNKVYVIPPGSTMTLSNGALKLNPKGKSLKPIDDFLKSLAIERKTQAIGIVLSGTGTDGTEGLKAIKAEGGITFAQNPESAQYAGMPQSAILAEVVDFILSSDKIAKELSKIAKNPHLVRAEIVSKVPKMTKETGLPRIFTLLKTSYDVDFTHYKETVVNRRVTRRMVINHIDNIGDYSDYLVTHPTERKALFDDMLIGVTSFFREPKTFEILEEKLLPELLKNKISQEPIRIWVPGCSTGEEAYSFAIAIQEFLEENGNSEEQVQIFGTDVNERNVDKARQGIYPKSIETNVSENRLKRFFTSFNGNYQIAKFIRDKCIFAKQDLTADPPFSNLDLISCRNMLIYFDSQLQERIVPILHYALKINGFLILGESESIGKFTTLFAPVQKKSFIYAKKNTQPRVNFGFEAATPYIGRTVIKQAVKKDSSALLREEVDRLLITEYVPAAMLVNSNLDILVFRGNVLPYLSPESGQTSLNVTRFLRKELRSEVQTAVYRVKKDCKPVTEEAVRFKVGELQKTVNIQVIPLQREEPFFLVLIEDVSSAAAHLRKTIELTASSEGRDNIKDSQIRELMDELDFSKRTLQTVVETQEATNEELRSAMEEVQSSNEELQSTNEELETAKEELQSSNEELTTLNDELKNRNQALSTLSDNQTNLTRNVDPAVVMVDGSLKIRLFTPSAQKILNLAPSDSGLPISSVHLAISVLDLEKNILDVIKTLGAENIEVSDEKGRFYELRIRPYVTEDKRIDGAVLSFIDINELREHENKLRVEEEKFRTLAENSPDIIARFDKNLRFLYVNSAIKEISRVLPKNFVGKTNEEAGLPGEFAESWNRVLQEVILTGKVEKGEFDLSRLDEMRVYQCVIVPEFSVKGVVETVLSLVKEITESKKLANALAESEQKYRTIVETAAEGIVIAKPDGAHIFVNKRLAQMFGYSTDELLHKSSFELLSEEEQKRQALQMRKSLENEQIQYGEFEFRRKDGSKLWTACNASPLFDENGKHIANISLFSDITERKKAEGDLRKQASLIDLSPDAIIVKKLPDSIIFWSKGAQNLYGWTKEEALGKKSRMLLKTKYPEPIKEILTQLKRTGRWSGEKIQETKSGREIVVNSRWLASCNALNEIEEVLETNVDITERKQLQTKLEEYTKNLESLIEERTKQLKDSERLAAIGTVAGMVGHDIRNPLQTITCDVYLAKTDLALTSESEEKKNIQESLMEIEKNADYINKIVADLQDFTKPLTPKIEEMELEKIVRAALDTINIPENVTVKHFLKKDFPKIKADPTYLQRILINLSNNAIQAMPKGGKLIISAIINNNKTRIIVQDTGEGLPENVKSKIFTPLLTTKVKGHGLGLPAVKRFTEAMGGTVTFESEVGKGTKFIIELPFVKNTNKF
jgi:two-component system CheB/CheR fusion protein